MAFATKIICTFVQLFAVYSLAIIVRVESVSSSKMFSAEEDDDGGAGGSSGNNDLKIFVGNLPFSCDQQKLGNIFSRFGSIVGVNLRVDRNTNKPRGFGFVTFELPDNAKEAIAEMNGVSFEGRILSVGPAQNRGTGPMNKEDEQWKTAPPPRKTKGNQKDNTNGATILLQDKPMKGKSIKETSRRSWGEWAGPVAKMDKQKTNTPTIILSSVDTISGVRLQTTSLLTETSDLLSQPQRTK